MSTVSKPFWRTLAAAAAIFHTGLVLAQPPATRVTVAAAKLLDAHSTITLVGSVDAARRSKVAAEIAGIVKEMPARQGDFVHVGDVLAQLLNDTLRLRLVEATARADARSARHQELLAGTRSEIMTRLQADLDEAGANLERWQFEMQRIERLYQGSDSNSKEFHDTRADFAGAQRKKVAAQASFEMGRVGPRKEEIARAAYDLAEQRAVVDRLRSDLSKTTIRAPFDGFVVSRSAEIGEWIPVGGAVVELVEMETVLVRVNLPESAFPYVAVGQSTPVKIDALKRVFDGRVKHIVPQADLSARTFPLEIEIDNSDRQLAVGMFARATVAAGTRRKVVAVPKDAVVHRDGVDYLALAVPGGNHGMTGILLGVTVGGDIEDWIEITSGNLKPGTVVITRGNEHIMPFPTPIIVVDEAGSPVGGPSQASAATHKKKP